ncbi:uncharacterized protein LOC123989207 [Osmia bicornis bicornis]|uniref:uncharacterized protein LOC123989207 n=1 Tax=Osmia bicornis bicornis TaxID=1437191 RepID=UPI001EAEB311|nr:uncharacterized protein LOC123989207 [Osmia bicornis bicornis]
MEKFQTENYVEADEFSRWLLSLVHLALDEGLRLGPAAILPEVAIRRVVTLVSPAPGSPSADAIWEAAEGFADIPASTCAKSPRGRRKVDVAAVNLRMLPPGTRALSSPRR